MIKGGESPKGKIWEWRPLDKSLFELHKTIQVIRDYKNVYKREDFSSDISYKEVLADLDCLYAELMAWVKEKDEKLTRENKSRKNY